MSESTPTTEYVRDMYVEMHLFGLTAMDEFDRWLAQHDKELRESIAEDIEAASARRDRGNEFALIWGSAYTIAARIARREM